MLYLGCKVSGLGVAEALVTKMGHCSVRDLLIRKCVLKLPLIQRTCRDCDIAPSERIRTESLAKDGIADTCYENHLYMLLLRIGANANRINEIKEEPKEQYNMLLLLLQWTGIPILAI